MEIDLSIFDPAYEALILDVIKRIKKLYSRYKIETIYKHYSIEDDGIVLFINNRKFVLNMDEYIEDSYLYNEKVAFQRLQEKIEIAMHT